MSFEPKKYNDLFEAMRQQAAVVSDFEVGSVNRTFYEAFAYELASLYEKMQLVYLAGFIDTAQGQQLDQVVAVLGIRRGLPDFAEGDVAFIRDVGNEDILIPLGTLVATEDTEENPKKVYKTIEQKNLPRNQVSITVKVQALERDATQVTPAETIIVMPRPIPGIKAVTNPEATRFLGKRPETDEELRRRAKNALISSGKASIISIENALLAMPGIKDARVKEYFYYARGTVDIELKNIVDAPFFLPKGTRFTGKNLDTNNEADREITLHTLEEVRWDAETTDETKKKKNISVESLTQGPQGEIPSPADPDNDSWPFEDSDIESKVQIVRQELPAPIVLEEYGVIDVIVDGPNLEEDLQKKQEIIDEIDRWRAAGIYARLASVRPVTLDGIFRIELDPGLNLSAESRREYEVAVEAAVTTYLDGLKMGQPLAFPKLIQQMLSLDGIDDLEDIEIEVAYLKKETPSDEEDSGEPGTENRTFQLSDKRISLGEIERFSPRYICVASEVKELPIDLEFKVADTNSDDWDALEAAISNGFNSIDLNSSAIKKLLDDEIGAGQIEEDTLKATPHPWAERAVMRETEVGWYINISRWEKPVLGKFFPYNKYLDLTGAIRISLPSFLTDEEQAAVREEVLKRINAYLDALGGEDVILNDLAILAGEVEGVRIAHIDPDDFRAQLSGADAPDDNRITDGKVTVNDLEKVRLAAGGDGTYLLCVAADIQWVEITLQSPIMVQVISPVEPEDQASVSDDIRTAVANAFNGALTGIQPGEDVRLDNLKSALLGKFTGANYEITALPVQATSVCDGREQAADLNTTTPLHIRSVERAMIKSIGTNDVVVSFS